MTEPSPRHIDLTEEEGEPGPRADPDVVKGGFRCLGVEGWFSARMARWSPASIAVPYVIVLFSAVSSAVWLKRDLGLPVWVSFAFVLAALAIFARLVGPYTRGDTPPRRHAGDADGGGIPDPAPGPGTHAESMRVNPGCVAASPAARTDCPATSTQA